MQQEILGFFQRDPVPENVRNQRHSFRAVFYDSNQGSNLLGIARRFTTGMNMRVDGIYSNASHGLFNRAEVDSDGIRGRLTFLELLLQFKCSSSPFAQPLELRPITGNFIVGHRGPKMYDPTAGPTTRNRYIPHHQESTGGRVRGRGREN